MEAISHLQKEGAVMLPTLEDANSIQVALADVIRMLRTQEVDHRTAALMLYALQTASANLKHTSFEPEPTHVVIDRDSVARRPIGATAWSKVEGREYDDLENDDLENNDLEEDDLEEDEVEKDRAEKECVGKDAQEFMADLKRLTDGVARDPGFLDQRVSDFAGEQERNSSSPAAAPTAEELSGG
jgi:hypothetical protein